MTELELGFLQIIRMVMGISREIPCDLDWPQIWKLAEKNRLEVIVFEAARTDAKLPEGLRQEMRQKCDKMLVRTILQSHCLETIETMFRDAGIPYGIQKGGILRDDYPKITFRHLTDIDFYVRQEDRKRIHDTLVENNVSFLKTESGDEQYCMSGELGIEFHGRLLYCRNKTGIENYPCWEMVDMERNRLTEEGYALNLIGHAVYDLSRGGPGIRHILDIWVYRHRHKPQPDWNMVNDWLKKDGIYDAAKNLMDLAEWLFGEGQETPLLCEMADYIMQGNLRGDVKREAVSELALAGNRRKALLKQLFRNRAEFENRYPWLKKYPFLMPMAWILRLWNSIRRHKQVIKDWQENSNLFSKEEILEQKNRLSRFGL